ncbi:MAG: DnaJ domain-containing protein [Bacteroidales bacterium]|jgi:hypothetical protein|nr:DnaJ domain-containing protein [Bacteroidales bacterium]MDD4213714.1 DnaJ domain-containing protein [Bacteroidales bacterium]
MAVIDYYKILGISHHALPHEIKKAYKEKARKYHPDVYHGKDSVEIFQLLNTAYHTLIDPALRKRYDFELKYPGSHKVNTDPRFRHPADASYYQRSTHQPPAYPKHYARNIRRLNRFILYSIVGILCLGIIYGMIDLILNFNFIGLLFSMISLAILIIGVRIVRREKKSQGKY